jgi:hypothetical protein
MDDEVIRKTEKFAIKYCKEDSEGKKSQIKEKESHNIIRWLLISYCFEYFSS